MSAAQAREQLNKGGEVRLHEVVAKAVKADPLGEQAARKVWCEDVRIEVSSHSNSMTFIGIEGVCEEYHPSIEDILADDWVYLGSAFNEKES